MDTDSAPEETDSTRLPGSGGRRAAHRFGQVDSERPFRPGRQGPGRWCRTAAHGEKRGEAARVYVPEGGRRRTDGGMLNGSSATLHAIVSS